MKLYIHQSLFCYKNLYYFLIFSFIFNLTVSEIISQSIKNHVNSYGQGSFEKKTSIYTFHQLMKLKEASKPRYVKVLDQIQYINTRKIIKTGILFTYKSNTTTKKVAVAGSFNEWSEIYMKRNNYNVFFFVLPIEQGKLTRKQISYRYKFIVDGLWRSDPKSIYKRDDKNGGFYSMFYLDNYPINKQVSVYIEKARKGDSSRWVEFAIYLPKTSRLSLIGNFNNWNPEHDIMTADKDGVFRYRIKLIPGQYIYKYIADGKWIMDKYNSNTRFAPDIQELGSFIEVK